MANKKKVVLVDGSSYLYRAFHALPPLTAPDGRPTGVIYGVLTMLNALIEQEQPDFFAVVFDAKGKTFRHKLYPEYKAHRPPMPPELGEQVGTLFELVRLLGYPLVQVDEVEADDVIGTLAKQAVAQGCQVVISTGDKDLMQLVNEDVCLYDAMKRTYFDRQGVKEKLGVFPQQVVDYLTLVGDKSDNIPGVQGVGNKTAVKWLEAYDNLENLLEKRGELKGKILQNLEAAVDQLPLMGKLVTIDDDLALDVEIATLKIGEADEKKLSEIYESLGFQKLLRAMTTEQTSVESSHQLILTRAALREWLEALRDAPFFALRIETDSADYMQADIIGIAFAAAPENAAYVPLAHNYDGAPSQLSSEEVLDEMRPLLEDGSVKKGGHNLKYIRNVLLAGYGISLRGIIYDSMLESYIYDSTMMPHNEKLLAQKYLEKNIDGIDDLLGKGRLKRTFDQLALKKACHYACELVSVSMQLHRFFNERLRKSEQQQTLYEQVELPLLSVLSDVELQGVCVDAGLLECQSAELGIKIKELAEKIYQEAGRTFNLDSPSQIREILFDDMGLPIFKKTPKGEPSTAEDVLREMAYEHELPGLLLEYRSFRKLQTTYTDKLPNMLNPKTQRIHTSYHQAATVTGRLSSSDPNLQNIPIRTAEGRRIRQAFVPSEGFQFIAADYSQIELRIMAHFSGDKRLCRAFEKGLDIHAATASEVFEIPLDQVTAEQRRSAKAINFGLIYSISAFGLAKQLNTDRESAQAYLNLYFERYPGIKNYMDTIKQTAAESGYVETLFGRRIYLPDIKTPRLKAHVQRLAINAPMQGTAADIIKQAMLKLHSHLQANKLAAKIVMQVHDELVLEVSEADMDVAANQCREIMASVADLKVPLVVAVGSGSNWDKAH